MEGILNTYTRIWTALAHPHGIMTNWLLTHTWNMFHSARMTFAVLSICNFLFIPLKYTNPY